MKHKHKIFCDNYFLYNDLQKAASLVGYKESTAKALLNNSDIKIYLASLEQNIASSNEIMQCLTSIMRGNLDEFLLNNLNNLNYLNSLNSDITTNLSNDLYSQAITLISNTSNNLNNKNSKSTISTREQLKAAELLGKALALFSPKSTEISNIQEPLYINFLGVDELLN